MKYLVRFEAIKLFTFLFTFLSCGFVAVYSHGLQTSVTNNTIRVITYNCQFLPEPASFNNERSKPIYRAGRIAKEVSQFDIVALQEMFHDAHRNELMKNVRTKWKDKLNHVFSPTPNGFFTSGGCLLMTPREILASNSIVYENRSKPEDYGLRADGFAAKGVIHGRIGVNGNESGEFIDVYVTHLEARGR